VLQALIPGVKPDEPDILDTLHREHDEVQALLEKLVDSDNGRERKSLVTRIKKALVPHSKAEEKVVYNPVIALRDKEAKIEGNEGYVEHGLASETLLKLSRMTKPMSPKFSAHAKVLKELIAHHVKEEERDIWDQVKKNFNAEERAQMNLDFEAAKKKVRV
jgi:hemerythrin superfamily protein